MLPFWRVGATLATQHPSQAAREPEAEGGHLGSGQSVGTRQGAGPVNTGPSRRPLNLSIPSWRLQGRLSEPLAADATARQMLEPRPL